MVSMSSIWHKIHSSPGNKEEHPQYGQVLSGVFGGVDTPSDTLIIVRLVCIRADLCPSMITF